MRYFIRDDGKLSQVDEITNPTTAKVYVEKYTEITESEYLDRKPKESAPLPPSYEALAASKINAKYTPDEENAILRKTLMALYSELGGEPSPEFKKYYSDAEACKAEARAELAKK